MNIFNPNFDQIGISSGPHKLLGHISVVDLKSDSQGEEFDQKKYQIDQKEWPENAVQVEKLFERQIINNKVSIFVTYNFTIIDQSIVTVKKVFEEEYTEPILS